MSASAGARGCGGGGNGSGNQACAACKYQRRKCTPDCILAPFFPPDQHRQFLNAHKLFGVSNILKIIRNLDPITKAEAMRSIMFQSDARAKDPVGGCYRIILELQRQLDQDSAELELLIRQLAVFRDRHSAQLSPHDVNLNATINMLNAAAAAEDYNNNNNHMMQQQELQQFHSSTSYHHQQDVTAAPYPWLPIEASPSHAMSPPPAMFDRKQTSFLVDSLQSFAPYSDGDGLRDDESSMEQVQEHDLKGAASLFTLTNNNTSSI